MWTVREKRWKGRSRAGDDAELEERVGGVNGARRGDDARSLLKWCDAPWSRGWRADGGNERDGVVGDRQACVSDGCGARRMMLGRWWGSDDDGVDYRRDDGTVSRPGEVDSQLDVG